MVNQTDTEKVKILGELRAQAVAAMGNVPNLMASWKNELTRV
jgi:hypothetical protein